MIIDFHAHTGVSGMYGNKSCGGEKLVKLMDKAKIDKAVLLPTASCSIQKLRYYEDVVEDVKNFPERFIGFYLANPRDDNSVQKMEEAVTKYNLKGVKLHPTFFAFAADDDSLVYPIVKKAEQLNIPVMIHSGQSPYATPWQIGLVAMDFPNITVIMAHMGSSEIVYTDAAIKMAKRAPNLILETTGVTSDTMIKKAVNEIGANRVVYGSDMPVHNPEVEMAKIKLCGISKEEQKLVLGGNAARLFNI